MRTVAIAVLSITALGMALGAGCGHTVREIVHDGIDEASKPENVAKVTRSAHDLASALVTGAFDGTPSTSRASAALEPLIDDLVRTTLRAAAAGLDTELSPAVARAVRSSVDATLAGLLAEPTRRGLEDLENALIGAAMTGLTRGIRDQIGPAIAETLDKSIGPALRHAIEAELAPAIARALSDLKPTLVDTAHQTAAAAGAGLVEGVRDQAEPLLDKLAARLREELDHASQDARSVLDLVLIAIFALAAGVLGVVAFLRHRAAVGATDALQLVSSQIHQASGADDVRRLAGRIRDVGQNTRGGEYLSRHLRAHPAIKIPSSQLPP